MFESLHFVLELTLAMYGNKAQRRDLRIQPTCHRLSSCGVAYWNSRTTHKQTMLTLRLLRLSVRIISQLLVPLCPLPLLFPLTRCLVLRTNGVKTLLLSDLQSLLGLGAMDLYPRCQHRISHDVISQYLRAQRVHACA